MPFYFIVIFPVLSKCLNVSPSPANRGLPGRTGRRGQEWGPCLPSTAGPCPMRREYQVTWSVRANEKRVSGHMISEGNEMRVLGHAISVGQWDKSLTCTADSPCIDPLRCPPVKNSYLSISVLLSTNVLSGSVFRKVFYASLDREDVST